MPGTLVFLLWYIPTSPIIFWSLMANSLFNDSCVHHLGLDVYFRNNNNQISSGKRLAWAFILGTNQAHQVRTWKLFFYFFLFFS